MEDIGLVFGGGGGKGAYQIGVWDAMQICGADKYVKAVSGTSVGALNAVLFALGDYDKACNIWNKIKQLDVTAPNLQLTDGLFSHDGLDQYIDSLDLQQLIHSKVDVYITVKHIADKNLFDKILETFLKISYFPLNFFVPTNIHIGELVKYFGEGEIHNYHINSMNSSEIKDIMLASAAMAIIYNSVYVNEKRYIDAGVTEFSNVPISPLYERGLKNIWVVPLSNKFDMHKIKTGAFSDFDAHDEYKDCNFKVIKPSKHLGGTLDFSKSIIKKRFDLGKDDAIEAMSGMFF
ncbi:MAG: patatin-like phospholipase family protein [Oscillospiraceae bacterium]|nr:patatin-like phospholipase family protein [Oscillospiraceae bacterium]